MTPENKVFIAGHRGMVGSALHRALQKRGFRNLLTAPKSELDLTDAIQTRAYFERHRPEVVFMAAAKVGGIEANRKDRAGFMWVNLMIQNNVIKACHDFNVKKLVFLGSSCVYPKECPQPIKEEYLLTGPLEPTNEGYALAKISGIRLSQYYAEQYGMDVFNAMPCNLYGPGDSFDLNHSHVLSALVRRFVDALDSGQTSLTLWGTGIAKREFLHVDDLAEGILHLMERWNQADIINVGSGTDVSIKELAELIAKKVGFQGQIQWDSSRPDGMLRKCMDVSKMHSLGFRPSISLQTGIDQMISTYRDLKAKGEIR